MAESRSVLRRVLPAAGRSPRLVCLIVVAAAVMCATQCPADTDGSVAPQLASPRGMLVTTALPFAPDCKWRISSTEFILAWVEYSPSSNIQMQFNGSFLLFWVYGESGLLVRARLLPKALHGGLFFSASGYWGGDESPSGDSWLTIRPILTYQAEHWDATVGLSLTDNPSAFMGMGSRAQSLIRFSPTDRLMIIIESQTVRSDEENHYYGYIMPALRWHKGNIAVDLGIGLGYEGEHVGDKITSGLSALPLPYVGISYSF